MASRKPINWGAEYKLKQKRVLSFAHWQALNNIYKHKIPRRHYPQENKTEAYPNPSGSIHSMPRGKDCKLLSTFIPIADAFFSIFWATGTAFVSRISRTLRASCQKSIIFIPLINNWKYLPNIKFNNYKIMDCMLYQ